MASLPEGLQHALADRYRIEREVGRGGMATVYLARDVKHDRRVAIKVLHPDLARSVGPERFLADGITEEITSRLAEIREIGVISRTSAMQYKGTTKALRQIGEELGVEYVLEGTVRWQKDADASRVRVTPQVIRVSDDTHLWTDRYDAVLSDVFAVQAEIAEQVAGALGVALAPAERAEVAEAPTANVEAYDYYLRGKDYSRRGWDPDDLHAAVDLYERAVALDPTFAAAWAQLSTTHSVIYWFFVDHTDARRARAKAAADSALAYGPDLADAHIALGNYHYWGFRDYERALAAFARARQLQPNNAEIYGAIGNVQRRQGRWDDAVASHRRKLELDPRDYTQVLELAFTLVAMRRFDDAGELVERAAALAPDRVMPLVIRAYLRIAADGDTVAARTVLRSLSDPAKAADALAEAVGSPLEVLAPWVGPDARLTLLGAPVRPATRSERSPWWSGCWSCRRGIRGIWSACTPILQRCAATRGSSG